ncbi:AAA family ATPase [Nonomuraea gerenzanensis]|uniref:Conserved domain protein n=1 Tax=Nonomuraea gerenzanensis TaxID=93944 RepID=A0A1M4E0D5_9ACTN|nr:AAA family ATPase [Nonomuraea gerenzanensis]UBU14567.1 AAA family ATPase [Nonomuraea gerenzanensis]SBO92283.1 Conserved domain protein [Nonomuraea gerenzanensis]
MLIVIGGLPGTGKTTLSRLLAERLGAVHVRIDTIEQAIVRSGLARQALGPAGYAVGYALTEDHLRQGLTVIAESVNPLTITRDAWRAVGERAGVPIAEVEVTCSDPQEHRHRVASRTTDIPDLRLPEWEEVVEREYEPWERDHLTLDTAGQTPQASLATLLAHLRPIRAGVAAASRSRADWSEKSHTRGWVYRAQPK